MAPRIREPRPVSARCPLPVLMLLLTAFGFVLMLFGGVRNKVGEITRDNELLYDARQLCPQYATPTASHFFMRPDQRGDRTMAEKCR